MDRTTLRTEVSSQLLVLLAATAAIWWPVAQTSLAWLDFANWAGSGVGLLVMAMLPYHMTMNTSVAPLCPKTEKTSSSSH